MHGRRRAGAVLQRAGRAGRAGPAGRGDSRRPARRSVGASVVRPVRAAWLRAASARWARKTCGLPSKARPAKPACCWSRDWSICSSARSKVNPGPCPCCPTRSAGRGSEREGRTLTVAGYRTTGGIRGAVAQTAEEVYERLPAEQRPLLRDLLLRLVAPSPNGEPVRARVPRRTLAADAVHEGLIEQLAGARLVTTDGDVVELAHEALARAWPRLRGWLDDDVDGQRILRHLAGAADTWDTMGRPESELYRGLRLHQAVDWRDRARPTLSPTEEAFPRCRDGARRRGGTPCRGTSAASGPHQPATQGAARRRGRLARRRPRRRAAGVAAGQAGRPRDGGRRRRAGGGARPQRRPVGSLAPARGRGGTPRQLTRHSGESGGRAGAEAGPGRIDH